MTLKILVTGGTFDKEYNELTGELFFNKTHVPKMLKVARFRLDIKIENLMMVDSIHMTGSDVKLIVEECQKSIENKILITHGTDRMVETAKALGQTIKNKTIVLTGAMIPYTFGSSDGLFNLGSALAFVQTLPPGVYIAMNGKYFTWDNARKNKKTGDFEEKK